MTLRGKFIFLVAGVGLLPLLAGGIIFSLRMLDPTGVPSFEKTLHTLRIIHENLEPALDSGDFRNFGDIHPSLGVAVLGWPDSAVLYQGGTLKDKTSLEIQNFLEGDRDFQVLHLRSAEHRVRVIIASENPFYDLQKGTQAVVYLPGILLFVLLLFTAAMALYILQGINRSLKNLEAGTRRIAQGDVGSPLVISPRDALGSLAASLEEMRRQLKEEYDRRDRFIMGVSHDLKTPLAVIEGYLEALEDGFGSDPRDFQKFLEILREKSGLLGRRISHLIDLAKMTTRDWRKSLEPTNFTDFLTQRLTGFQEEGRIQNYTLNSDLRLDATLPVFLHRDLIQRVLENLIHNAVTYGGPEKRVTVRAWNDPGSGSPPIFVTVENQGPGIQAENLDKVFEPFFRESASRRDGGFGLGLATVKSIVELHGWSIRAESRPGEKTVFTLGIPYTPLP